MKKMTLLIIGIFLSGCSGTAAYLNGPSSGMNRPSGPGPDHGPYGFKKDYIDVILTNGVKNIDQYHANGFPVPDLGRYRVASKEYAPMPDPLKGEMYVVTFKNKQGDTVTKYYHKTHPMAYTVQRRGEEPYTIVDTTCKKVYDTKYFGKYEVPACVLELYSIAKPGGYLPGQFEPQEGFIKLRTPEPDDFNPYEDSPFSVGKHWRKACEWWDEDLMGN